MFTIKWRLLNGFGDCFFSVGVGLSKEGAVLYKKADSCWLLSWIIMMGVIYYVLVLSTAFRVLVVFTASLTS